jgi:hypothetical protein
MGDHVDNGLRRVEGRVNMTSEQKPRDGEFSLRRTFEIREDARDAEHDA